MKSKEKNQVQGDTSGFLLFGEKVLSLENTLTTPQHLCQAKIMIKEEDEKETWNFLTGIILQRVTVILKEIGCGK